MSWISWNVSSISDKLAKLECKFDELDKLYCKFDELAKLRTVSCEVELAK